MKQHHFSCLWTSAGKHFHIHLLITILWNKLDTWCGTCFAHFWKISQAHNDWSKRTDDLSKMISWHQNPGVLFHFVSLSAVLLLPGEPWQPSGLPVDEGLDHPCGEWRWLYSSPQRRCWWRSSRTPPAFQGWVWIIDPDCFPWNTCLFLWLALQSLKS